jgi:hypothetical protein
MITRAAVHGIPGADIAAITRIDDGRVYTEASTEELGRRVDEMQYAADEGPCLSAIREQQMFLIPDMSASTMTAFAPGAVQAGIGSALAFVLEISEDTIGALNLYSKRVNGFNDSDVAIGSVLATYAAFVSARANVIHGDLLRIGQLEEALKSRDIIGQAKGILMERESISSDEAFDMLKKISQRLNVKLREIAAKFVDEVEQRRTGR